MKILNVVRKNDMVHVYVPGGCYQFDIDNIPMGFNNETRHDWELDIDYKSTSIPFVRVPVAMMLTYRPKEAI